MKKSHATAWLAAILISACAAGEKGDTGERGERGHACSVVDDSAGQKRITCEDGTEVTLTDGVDGEAGPKGDKGDTGADGTSCTVADNQDGTKTLTCEDGTEVVIRDGENGADSACAGNTPPIFEGVTLKTLEGQPIRKQQSVPLRLLVADPDGDTLSVDFAGAGATFEPGDDVTTWTLTPRMEGGPFLYTVSISDGCSVVAGSFSIPNVISAGGGLIFLTDETPANSWHFSPGGALEEFEIFSDLGEIKTFTRNPVDGSFWFYIQDSATDDGLYRIGQAEPDTFFIGNPDHLISDMAFSPDGTLYAYSVEEHALMTFDLTTGELSNVVEFENAFDRVGIAFRNDTLYLKSANALYTVDPDSGELTELGTISLSYSRFVDSLEYHPLEDYFLSFYRSNGQTQVFSIDPQTLHSKHLLTIPSDTVVSTTFSRPNLSSVEVEVVPGRRTARVMWDWTPFLTSAYLTWSPDGPEAPIRLDIAQSLMPHEQLAFPEFEHGDHQWHVTGLEPDTTYTVTLILADTSGGITEFDRTVTTLPDEPAAAEVLYGMTDDGLLYTVDPVTGAATLVGNTGLRWTDAFAISPVTGKAFAVSNQTYKLYEINLETAGVTEIGPTGTGDVVELVFTSAGKLYGYTSPNLVDFSLENGAAAELLSLHFDAGTGLALHDGLIYLKAWNAIHPGTPDFVHATILVSDPVLLGNSLTFGSDGYGYSLTFDDGVSTLYRIDMTTWVATPVVSYEAGLRLVSVDFLKALE